MMDQIHEYLLSMTKEELIELVEKYAPEQFRTTVNNKFAGASAAQKIFNDGERRIRKIFADNDLLYDPNGFSHALDAELSKFSGLEKHLKPEIEQLLFFIFDKVDEAFEDGYLYDDYSDGGYCMSSDFEDFVARYVAALEREEKTKFLSKLDALSKNQCYSTFETLVDIAKSVFNEADLPDLKNSLLNELGDISDRLAGNYYDLVRHLLSYTEKLTVLTTLMEQSCKYLMELAELLDAHSELDKAIDVLNTWLTKQQYGSYEEAYLLYLDLSAKKGGDLSAAARKTLSNCPTCGILTKIVCMMPDDAVRYEQLLEQKDAPQLFDYLRQKNRLDDALALIKRRPTLDDFRIYDFFKNHKKIFPADAEKYFSKVIEKNLEEAGDRYYQTISKTIRELFEINTVRAKEYLSNIRTNYKRRRNLMNLLADL